MSTANSSPDVSPTNLKVYECFHSKFQPWPMCPHGNMNLYEYVLSRFRHYLSMWTTYRMSNDRWEREVNWAALCVFADEPDVQGVRRAGGRFPFWRLHMRGMQGKIKRNDCTLLPSVRAGTQILLYGMWNPTVTWLRFSETQSHLADETVNSKKIKSASHVHWRLRIFPVGGIQKMWGYPGYKHTLKPFKTTFTHHSSYSGQTIVFSK